jgi:hypothetical protein
MRSGINYVMVAVLTKGIGERVFSSESTLVIAMKEGFVVLTLLLAIVRVYISSANDVFLESCSSGGYMYLELVS